MSTPPHRIVRAARSEEHTSELQSQSNLVCRLLLEKKKVHRRTAPEAPDPDHLRAELLDQVDQEIQRLARAHEVLDEEDLRGRSDEPLELDRQRHPPLATREALGAVDDDRDRKSVV